jgi:hypothetical protein
VKAINAFHQEHGLVRFAVCCRTEEYKLTARLLQVQAAVEFQPPTPEQVSNYLAAAGDALVGVQAVLKADETLRQFLQSPLVLNIVALTYRHRSADALRVTGMPEQRLALLFNAYIKRMLEHGTPLRPLQPSPDAPLAGLAGPVDAAAQLKRVSP